MEPILNTSESTTKITMTSQFSNMRTNIQAENSQTIVNWSNNQPLFVLVGCFFIIISCALFSWYINIYLPEENITHELLLDDEFSLENKSSSDKKNIKPPTLV